jgi:3-methylcrotonyl-CoA carboxylase alpha subunit
VYVEQLVSRARHVEVQIIGDGAGTVMHLWERDCSLQRRHQKVIEEAPAPGMDEATREAICAAAVRAAKAVDYVGAGTIEFVADASEGLKADRVFFMEMNTRLQVEHPVTEEITGVDLVEWQLRVASGEPLPLRQEDLSINGHAIEARLYAEDPAKGFLPSTGKLDWLQLPNDLRIEAGVEEDDEVSPFYDPMIAKLIAVGNERNEAIERLLEGCREVEITPVRSNAWFLARLLDEPAFRAGQVTTGFIGENADRLSEAPEPKDELLEQAAFQAIYHDDFVSRLNGAGDELRTIGLRGFRLNSAKSNTVHLRVDGKHLPVEFKDDEAAFRDYWDDPRHGMMGWGATTTMFVDGASFATEPFRVDGSASASAADGAILAPMPGKVIAVDVAEGQAVEAGQRLMVLEAMKMEHALTAPFAGTVAELAAREGQQVQVETLLARVVKSEG